MVRIFWFLGELASYSETLGDLALHRRVDVLHECYSAWVSVAILAVGFSLQYHIGRELLQVLLFYWFYSGTFCLFDAFTSSWMTLLDAWLPGYK